MASAMRKWSRELTPRKGSKNTPSKTRSKDRAYDADTAGPEYAGLNAEQIAEMMLIKEVKSKLQNSKAFDSVPNDKRALAREFILNNDKRIRRFLIGQDSKVDKTVKEIEKSIETRSTKGYWFDLEAPLEKVDKGLRGVLETGGFYMYKKDKLGRPVIVFKCRKLQAGITDESILKGAMFTLDSLEYMLDRQTFSSVWNTPQSEDAKWILILDTQAPFQIPTSQITRVAKELAGTMGLCYPERAFKMFIVDPGWVINTAWNIIYPFLWKTTREKMTIAKRSKAIPTFLTLAHPEDLEIDYGGTDNFLFAASDFEKLCTIGQARSLLEDTQNDIYNKVKDPPIVDAKNLQDARHRHYNPPSKQISDSANSQNNDGSKDEDKITKNISNKSTDQTTTTGATSAEDVKISVETAPVSGATSAESTRASSTAEAKDSGKNISTDGVGIPETTESARYYHDANSKELTSTASELRESGRQFQSVRSNEPEDLRASPVPTFRDELTAYTAIESNTVGNSSTDLLVGSNSPKNNNRKNGLLCCCVKAR